MINTVLAVLLMANGAMVNTCEAPRNIVVDTDWASDVDDVVAMRVITYAHTHNKINLLAVMQSTTVSGGPGSLLGFLRSDGVNVPVGTSTTINSATGHYQANLNSLAISRLLITGSETYTDAVTLYRQQLASSSVPVDIVTIGYLNNLYDLLRSSADDISPLTGLELATAKVRRLYVMGGAYPKGIEFNFSHNAVAIAASSYVTANWPTPIIFSGFEVGQTVTTGASMNGLQPTDLLAKAMADVGTFNRPSWDPMNVLQAIVGEPTIAGYTEVYGSNSVNASTGANIFMPDTAGKDRYLVKSQANGVYQSVINFLILKSNW